MKEYLVKSVKMPVDDIEKINWSCAETAEIKEYPWPDWNGGQKYFPKCNAQVIRILDDKEKVKGIVAKLFCRENNPVSLYHNFYDPVYKDSCLEFFFSSKYCGKYVNCEMNSVGTSLIAVGDNRESRTPIDSFIKIPKIFSKKEFNGWSVTVFWSIDDLNAVLDDFSLGSGDCFYANFFKCGDETEYEHYCSWAPINAPTPNFHLPEFFGKMIIE